MIELLAVQAITTAALAFFVIKLRRELWPMITAAQPMVQGGFWLRSVDVLVLDAPQFEMAKVVTKVRWLFTEELFLRRRFRVYDVAMDPLRRHHYARWKAWMSGDSRYVCEVEKPRGLARLYNRAIDVFCKEKKEEKPQEEVLILPSKVRKRMYKRMLRQLREDAARRDSAEKSKQFK
jgi:hypothetical protein